MAYPPAQPPPDLDENLNPVAKPPDLNIQGKPEDSMLSRAWHYMADPLTDAPSRFARSVSNYLTDPNQQIMQPTGKGGLHDYLAERLQMGRGFLAGAGEGLGDLVSGFTSPINLATTAATMGSSSALKAGLPNIARTLSLGGKALSVPVIAHGASNLLSPDSTLAQRGQGLVEIAGGGAAMMHTPTASSKFANDVLSGEEPPTSLNPEFDARRQAIADDTARMAQERMNAPRNIEHENMVDDWNRNQRNAAIYEGRNINDATTPLTPQQQTIRNSYEKIRKFKDDYSAWFSEQEEKLPEGELFKPPPEIEAKYKSDLAKMESKHQALVDRLTGGLEKGRPDVIDVKPSTPSSTKALPSGEGDILDPYAAYRKVPVGTKYTISPENFNRKKMTDAMKLGFEFVELDDKGRIVIKKTRESPSLQEMQNKNYEDSIAMQMANLPRTIMASMDMSAPLRQGLGLIHKKAFWTSLPDMVKAFGSEDAYNAIQKSITQDESGMFRKTYNAEGQIQPSFAEKAGLKLTKLDEGMSNREESIMSAMAEKIPGIRASERAYTVFLNKLRADTFKQMVQDFGSYSGINAKNNLALSGRIADFVNTASGRGSLGALEGSAKNLSTVLFSPRLIASRLGMMAKGSQALFSPETYMLSSPSVRREYLKSLFAIAGAAGTFTGLAKLAGATVESDVASSDFGKSKFGNTRIDPYGGFQQYIVAAQRLMPELDLSALGLGQIGGKMKSTTTDREYSLGDSGFGRSTRADVLSRFIRSKTNPIINFGWGLLAGAKEISGKPMNFSAINPIGPQGENLFDNAIAQRFLPMLSQDIYDLVRDETTPVHAKALAAFMASLGMGSQTYGNER